VIAEKQPPPVACPRYRNLLRLKYRARPAAKTSPDSGSGNRCRTKPLLRHHLGHLVQNQHQHRYLRLGSKILKIKELLGARNSRDQELPQIAQVRLRNLLEWAIAQRCNRFRNWGRNWLGNRHGTGSGSGSELWHRHRFALEVAPAQVLVQGEGTSRERVLEMVIQQVRDQAVFCRNCTKPKYPERGSTARQEGTAISVDVDDKAVTNVRLARSSGHSALDEAAIREARRWKFDTQMVHGRGSQS